MDEIGVPGVHIAMSGIQNRRVIGDIQLPYDHDHDGICFIFNVRINLKPRAANCIGSVMVSVLASSAVDHEFEPRSGLIKNYENISYLLLLL